jgi:hypothetical protein
MVLKALQASKEKLTALVVEAILSHVSISSGREI